MNNTIFFRATLSALLLALSVVSFAQQSGYQINLTLKPYANQYVYLGYHYGKLKALADSAMLNENSEAVFRGTEPLPGGIYFIVSPRKEILFEILLDKDQQFTVVADTATLSKGATFSGSEDNEQFQNYGQFANRSGQEISRLNQQLKSAEGPQRESISAQIRRRSETIQAYRDSLSAKYPNSFLATLFSAMKEPKIPPPAQHPGGKYDSTFAYNYFKSNYWDGVAFNDDRLVRTPFFEPKLEKYFKDLVVPNSDTLKKEIDNILLQARTGKEMFKYLMVHFVQKYVNPEFMGQDAVFVHLFEKYINTGQATFFTDKYREFIDKRAYSLMANLIGKPAANMEMVDSLNRPMPLYQLKGDYTVVVFWDPTCGHCKEVVPKVDSIYQAKWKAKGVKVYGVKVDGSQSEWSKFLKENKIRDWVHVYQTAAQQDAEVAAGKPGFRQLYDVYQTPILYLLDKDKRILAKKLTYLQIDEVMDQKTKKAN